MSPTAAVLLKRNDIAKRFGDTNQNWTKRLKASVWWDIGSMD
jgi:hypothetical protein